MTHVQGTPSTPGLWEVETLLVRPELLTALAAKFPLAIVTGRPRADAERFLVQVRALPDFQLRQRLQHKIGSLFKTLVCMGEAAAKPSPEPVQRAMQALGVSSAVFIGDTPDDIRAGLAAGLDAARRGADSECCPGIKVLGVVAPSVPDVKKDAENLTAVGAAHVMLPGCPDLQLLLE